MTLVRKIVQGLIATPMIGLALTLIGYAGSAGGAQAVPSAETIARLKVLFFALPALFVALAFVASLRFLITPATHAIVRAELVRLRAGGARADAPAATRALIEALGGARYEEPRAAEGLS
jgi:oligogalacturonide transporter